MDSHKSAAERIRPILQAMERSIDTARRSRTKETPAPAPKPVTIRPIAVVPTPVPAAPPADSQAPTRLKARPKRFEHGAFASPFSQPVYRSQAS